MSGASRAAGDGSPWSLGDAWQNGGRAHVTVGVAAPGFRRLVARRRGARIELAGDALALRATV